jgi:hypothetical protein
MQRDAQQPIQQLIRWTATWEIECFYGRDNRVLYRGTLPVEVAASAFWLLWVSFPHTMLKLRSSAFIRG